MAQEYYYSSLSGPQIDAALTQISQAAGYASLAAISAEEAGASAEEARRFAQEATGYTRNQSDLRFASAIALEQSGATITVTGAADAPIRNLRIFGSTGLSSDPAPTAPASFQSAGPGSITVQLGDSALRIPTGEGIPGIPVYHKDSAYAVNYTDASGQKWICDEIDLARGVYIQRLFSITLDGSETWVTAVNGDFLLGALHYGALYDFGYDTNFNDAFHMCSHFRGVGYYQAADGTVVSSGTTVGIGLKFKHSGCADLDSWKAYLAAQAAAGTPVTLLLRRSSPRETALDPETLAAYDALRLDGTAVITNDASAQMALTFVADTKTYIDQKIAAISAALLNS